MREETITTWADGFGNWHARIDFPAPGYGPQYLDRHWDRIRAKVRREIRRKLRQRGNLGPGAVIRIRVAANNLDPANRMRSVTFEEVPASA